MLLKRKRKIKICAVRGKGAVQLMERVQSDSCSFRLGPFHWMMLRDWIDRLKVVEIKLRH